MVTLVIISIFFILVYHLKIHCIHNYIYMGHNFVTSSYVGERALNLQPWQSRKKDARKRQSQLPLVAHQWGKIPNEQAAWLIHN